MNRIAITELGRSKCSISDIKCRPSGDLFSKRTGKTTLMEDTGYDDQPGNILLDESER